jgi:hypothetical protein
MENRTAQNELQKMIKSLDAIEEAYNKKTGWKPNEKVQAINNVRHRSKVLQYCLRVLQQIEANHTNAA